MRPQAQCSRVPAVRTVGLAEALEAVGEVEEDAEAVAVAADVAPVADSVPADSAAAEAALVA